MQITLTKNNCKQTSKHWLHFSTFLSHQPLCSSAMFSTPFVLSFSLLLSLPLLFLFAPRILLPRNLAISLPDELDDLALFHRAAVSARWHPPPSPTPTSVPKIAFLFLTNTELYFAPLWERFFNGSHGLFNIYVHADPTCHIKSPSGVFAGRFIAGKRTQRSSPTLISAARRLLATALLDDPANYFFALVSQHCIPLHSFRYIYHSLFTSDLTGSSPKNHEASRRRKHESYQSFIEILANEPGLWVRYIARGKDVMMPEIPFSSFRVGSQFFILTRQHALLVIRDRQLWRKFKLRCLNIQSCYPEEHYFPTLLSMEDPDGCRPITLTHVNWTGSTDGHPHTYMRSELSAELIHRLRKSNFSDYSYFFARKFSPDSLEPLLKMAKSVLFRD